VPGCDARDAHGGDFAAAAAARGFSGGSCGMVRRRAGEGLRGGCCGLQACGRSWQALAGAGGLLGAGAAAGVGSGRACGSLARAGAGAVYTAPLIVSRDINSSCIQHHFEPVNTFRHW
jgi:hypothetical protein